MDYSAYNDNAIVNIPLSKRGDIDAQIDRYKTQKAKEKQVEHKNKYATLKADRITAKAMLAEELPELLKAYPRLKASDLRSDAHWIPSRVIRGIEQFRKERAADLRAQSVALAASVEES